MVDKAPVSDLCNELGIQPSLFYYWQQQAMENLAAAWRQAVLPGVSSPHKPQVR